MKDKKVVVVTGAFGALGSAVCSHLSESGWRVAMLDVATSHTFEDTPDRSIFPGVDVGSEPGAISVFKKVAARFGTVNALVNVAGTFRWSKVENSSASTLDYLYNINLRTSYCASAAALPYLLTHDQSAIVNVGAASAASRATTGIAAYSASKAGVAKLTESMADEFKDRGLRVNAVLPSIIDTPTNRTDMPDADFERWVTPEALAEVVGFLLSNNARAVTGSSLLVTGRT